MNHQVYLSDHEAYLPVLLLRYSSSFYTHRQSFSVLSFLSAIQQTLFLHFHPYQIPHVFKFTFY